MNEQQITLFQCLEQINHKFIYKLYLQLKTEKTYLICKVDMMFSNIFELSLIIKVFLFEKIIR